MRRTLLASAACLLLAGPAAFACINDNETAPTEIKRRDRYSAPSEYVPGGIGRDDHRTWVLLGSAGAAIGALGLAWRNRRSNLE